MGMRNFLDQTMSPQQTQFAAAGGALSSGFFFGARLPWIQIFSEVPIPKAIDGPLATAEDFQECGVSGVERVEGAKAIAVFADRLTELLDGGPQRFGAAGAGEGLQIAAIGGAADFCSPRHVGDCAAEPLPAAWGWVGRRDHAAIGPDNRLDAQARGFAHGSCGRSFAGQFGGGVLGGGSRR